MKPANSLINQAFPNLRDQEIARRVAARRPNPAPAHVLNRQVAHPDFATLDELDLTHHPLMQEGIDAARQWQAMRNAQVKQYRMDNKIPDGKVLNYFEPANASLILVASQVILPDGLKDNDRTGYGCGKTHIARAVLWSIRLADDSGQPVGPVGKFIEANRLILELDPADRGKYIQTMLMDTPILVIDDVGDQGTEQEIPFISGDRQVSERHARYYAIINHCYENGVSVVITANMTIQRLRDHVGGRAFSRLMEMAPEGQMVDLTGVPDYRKKLSGRKYT